MTFQTDILQVEGVKKLTSAVKSCNCSDILQLDLSKNELAIAPFFSILAQCSNLLKLDLSFNAFNTESARILSAALKNCVKLHNLDISSNPFCTDSVKSIASALKYCINLLQLKASGIYISGEGISAVQGLKGCIRLQELDISSNSIGCEGAKVLVPAFSHRYWTDLLVLDISSNDIGSEGIRALADGLIKCSTVQELYIRSNNIVRDDTHFLATPLKCFNHFHSLDISYNDLQISGASVIADALRHSKSLRVINFSGNNIGREEDAQQLLNSLEGRIIVSELNIGR